MERGVEAILERERMRSDRADAADAPDRWTRIEPAASFGAADLRELWRHRELVGFLALRDVKVRYKQSLLGVGWAVLQPLLTMLIFTLLFRGLFGPDRMPGAPGVPYALSTYCALVPWQLFATALTASGNSLVANQQLVTKVYFPRLAIPLAPILAALVDFALAFGMLLALMGILGVPLGAGIALAPLLALLAAVTAFAISLWLSALNALYRDVRHAIPFLVQIWMFATPVVYGSDRLLAGREPWVQWIYGLNPMTGVVEGCRWALLGTAAPTPEMLLASALSVSGILIGGLYFFKRMERRFADEI